jgi:hypothetical protein
MLNMNNSSNSSNNSEVNFIDMVSKCFEYGILIAAINLNLFELLKEEKAITEIKSELKLNCEIRNLADFLDKLMVTNYLTRSEEILSEAKYKNTPTSEKYFTANSPDNIITLMLRLKMYISRILLLPEILISGSVPNQDDFFDLQYKSQESKMQFQKAMINFQKVKFDKISKNFDFSKFKTFLDVGGGLAYFSIQIKLNNPHLECYSFDLSVIENDIREYLKEYNMEDSVECVKILTGDMFANDFPIKTDIVSMGNILHDWNEEKKKSLFKKAFDCLNEGGIFFIIEDLIDDERKNDSVGLNFSLIMLLMYANAFNMSFKDIENYALEAGFKKVLNMREQIGVDLVVCYK